MPTFDTTGRTFSGLAVDRSVFQKRLPDARWLVYAAGWVNAGDANVATISLVYEKDDGSQVMLGSVTHNTGTKTKKVMGPFDVFATVGVPAGEQVPMVRLKAVKSSGADGTIENWTIYLRLLAARQ